MAPAILLPVVRLMMCLWMPESRIVNAWMSVTRILAPLVNRLNLHDPYVSVRYKMADRPIPERVKLDDPDLERKVMRMLESLDSDVELSEIEEDDQYSESEHDTDSAISADEDGPASEGSVRSSESEGNDENELNMDDRM
ncbi:unnamed protein product [Acanthoscelides obtectus]|uniref:Uncharacterized protein n=1 Tax=Acanthoscelides obtectus TaxID=200917 RepID=A0A9P0L9J4_ACAOB|nr:unnamed protein product [Acanthoscelides obtectus]CAK1624539.1 hypothetical protein AOBTE_LOCUS2597 [Acanthoscelides obtectus]